MASSTTYTSKEKRKRAKLFLLSVAVGMLTLFLTIDLSGVGGNIRFYSKWIECGQKPVVTNPTPRFAGSIFYYDEAPIIQLLRLSPIYYCTPLQAEVAGYSASDRDRTYPHVAAASQQAKDAAVTSKITDAAISRSVTNMLYLTGVVFVAGATTTAILYYKSRQLAKHEETRNDAGGNRR